MAPALTPEEKKALAEQKKLEKLRLAELEAIRLQHEGLEREIKFGQLTMKRHEKDWKEMLTNIALPRMRKDLKFAWHNFERMVDYKDFTISLLLDELSDAEEQYLMNFRCHSENTDKLIGIFRDRLNEIKTDTENEILRKRNEAEEMCNEISTVFASNEEYLKMMLYGLEAARREQEQYVRGEYLSKIDEEMSKYNDILQHLRSGLEKRASDVWNNTKVFFKNYREEMSDREKAYRILSQQDKAINQLCTEQLKKIDTNQALIKKLKEKYTGIQEAQEQIITDLIAERQYFADSFWILKTRLETDRNLDFENLSVLTLKSNEVMKHLEGLRKQGKQLLQLSAICRKFETLEEKILPFPLREISKTESKANKKKMVHLEEYENVANLKLFWQRVAQVDAIRYSMNEEREFLKRENKNLKQKIHNYCQCLDCPTFNYQNIMPFIKSKKWKHDQTTVSGDQSLLVTEILKKC